MLLERKIYRDRTLNRCIKCTLPLGTCKHKDEWEQELELAQRASFKQKKQYERYFKDSMEEMVGGVKNKSSAMKDQVSEQMSALYDVIGGGVVVDTQPVAEDVDIERIRWYHFEPRLSDKIGDTYFALSVPPSRGWHSCVAVGSRFIVVFGGFRFRENMLPQPFQTALQAKDVKYLNCTYVYDKQNQSWHHPKPSGVLPPGRYGHAAAAIDNTRMVIFGGRGEGGGFLQDTWIFDINESKWHGPLYGDDIHPSPSARAFSATFSARSSDLMEEEPMKVYLFGGTNGLENFSDLWFLKQGREQGADLKDMMWERAVAIGFGPNPRYGHQMLSIGGDMAVVLGGTAVSAQSEISIADMNMDDTRRLYNAGAELQEAYRKEGELPVLAGKALSKNPGDLRSLVGQASSIAGNIQVLEAYTREKEVALADEYYRYEARSKFFSKKAAHPDKDLDVFFLNIRDLTWHAPAKGEMRGPPPSARMHFSATCVGHFVLVTGGTAPTSLSYGPIDNDYSRTYALDTANMTWLEPAPIQTSNYFDIPMQIAESDIIRAEQKCKEEKLKGMSKGVRRGETPAFAEAEAVLQICKWRKNMLSLEKHSFRRPPSSRWGGTLCTMGQRALLMGGWGAANIINDNDSYVIDLEPELERNRRLEDEFEAKLERERVAEEGANYADLLSANYEKRAMAAAERANEAREREQMAVEEIRCCVPPLSVPNPVRLVAASHNTIWVEWDPPVKKSSGDKLTDEEMAKVMYILWVSGGYVKLYEGDRVIVNIGITTEKITDRAEHDEDVLGDDEDDEEDGEEISESDRKDKGKITRCVDFHGEIMKVRINGLFDIAFDDGTVLKNYPRSKIRLETDREPRTEPISHSAAQKSANRKQMRERFSRYHHERERKKAEEKAGFELRQRKLGVKVRMKRLWIDDHPPVPSNAPVARPLPIFSPTVKVPSEFRLVYMGEDTKYACEGLVPDEALLRELQAPRPLAGPLANAPIIPSSSVNVTFCVQMVGVDYPIEEHSMLSAPVTFSTKPNPQPWLEMPMVGATSSDEMTAVTSTSTLSEDMGQMSLHGPPSEEEKFAAAAEAQQAAAAQVIC